MPMQKVRSWLEQQTQKSRSVRYCMGSNLCMACSHLEVFPVAFNTKGRSFLQAEAQKVLLPAVWNGRILELKNIMQADFFLQRFNNDKMR